MSRASLLRVTMLALAVGALAACAGTTRGPNGEPVEDRSKLVRAEDFLILTKDGVPDELRNTIEIRGYRAGPNIFTELHEVELEVYNVLEKSPVRFEIRTLFFREDGTVLDATEWVEATAPPRNGYRYRSMAFSTYAVSEQVQLRLLTTKPATAKP